MNTKGCDFECAPINSVIPSSLMHVKWFGFHSVDAKMTISLQRTKLCRYLSTLINNYCAHVFMRRMFLFSLYAFLTDESISFYAFYIKSQIKSTHTHTWYEKKPTNILRFFFFEKKKKKKTQRNTQYFLHLIWRFWSVLPLFFLIHSFIQRYRNCICVCVLHSRAHHINKKIF